MTPPSQPYISAKEAAARIAAATAVEVSDDTIRNWVKKGLENKKAFKLRYQLKGIRVGGRLYVLEDSLVLFIQQLQSGDSA
jgi:hypothetical protein